MGLTEKQVLAITNWAAGERVIEVGPPAARGRVATLISLSRPTCHYVALGATSSNTKVDAHSS